MDKLQKEFEAWLESEFGMWAIQARPGVYGSEQIQDMWKAWQAALSANGGEVMAFGNGDYTVEVGGYDDEHAVFVAPAIPPGRVGDLAEPTTGEDRHRLVPGERVMTFPTEAQAFAVAEAIAGRKINRVGDTHPAPPSVAVPEFLLEMSKQMREQPNRMTSHPFWQVRCNRYLPTVEGCAEHHTEVCGDDGVVYRSDRPVSELHEYLIENHEEWCQQWAEENHDDDHWKEAIECYFDLDCDDLPDELRKVPVQEVEEVVSTHLTQVGAEQFIKRKQHDYPKLFTYVESAYWSPQLRALQDWIISLTAAPSPDHSGDAGKVVSGNEVKARVVSGARDMLRESGKQFRAIGDIGHAAMCENHADELDRLRTTDDKAEGV